MTADHLLSPEPGGSASDEAERSRRALEVSAASTKTLGHGRFAGGPAAELLAYTVSLAFDQRLWPDDITGSRAHVTMLAEADRKSVV